jgi:hypothetical protein
MKNKNPVSIIFTIELKIRQYLFVIIIFLSFLGASFKCYGQEKTTNRWKTNGTCMFLINQAGFHNWTAGGVNSLSISGFIFMDVNYQKEKISWLNNYTQVYGVASIGDFKSFRKTQDILMLSTKASLKHTSSTHFSLFADLTSQATKGYASSDHQQNTPVSSLFSPATLVKGVGYEYRNDSIGFHSLLSPLALKHTFILNSAIDETQYGLKSGQKARQEVGLYLQMGFERKIMKNTFFKSKALLYTNYFNDFGIFDVYWSNKLTIRANRWLSASLRVVLVYDQDTVIPGKTQLIKGSSALQVMELIGFGTMLTF